MIPPNPCPNFNDAPEFIKIEYDGDPPDCAGEWISGSGGHRNHLYCGELASWWHPDDCDAYCDKHINEHDALIYTELWEKTNKETK